MKIWHRQAATLFMAAFVAAIACALSEVGSGGSGWPGLASPAHAAQKAAPQAKTANTPTISTPPLPERNPGQGTAAVPDPQRPAAAPPAPPAKPNLTLTARLAPGAERLERGLAWRIYPLKSPQTPPAEALSGTEPVWSGAGTDRETRLAPGRYAVVASFGLATALMPVEIGASGSVDAELTLNAGRIEAAALAQPDGQPLDNVFFTVAAADASAPGGWRILGRSTLSRAVFHVPAGRYRVSAEHGFAAASVDVVVEAGKSVSAQPVLNCGVLVLETARAGEHLSGGTSSPRDLVYVVHEDNGAGPPGPEIARSAAAQPTFTLPAGRYRIIARSGLAEAETAIALAAGQTLRERLVLQGGSLKLASKRSGNGKSLSDAVQYTLHRLAGDTVEKRLEPGRAAALGRELFLASGRYRIESRLGDQNAVETAEIEILPGSSHDLTFEHKAAEIRLSLIAKPGGPALDGVLWTVLAREGAIVATTQDAAPKLILKPGTYRVIAQRGSKVFSHEFEASVGDARSVEVLAK